MTLEMIQRQSSSKKGPRANQASTDAVKMQSGLGVRLDELRQSLASFHGGIFPHSVLSSQHINLLCTHKPATVEQVCPSPSDQLLPTVFSFCLELKCADTFLPAIDIIAKWFLRLKFGPLSI